jgi:hypothetical protein
MLGVAVAMVPHHTLQWYWQRLVVVSPSPHCFIEAGGDTAGCRHHTTSFFRHGLGDKFAPAVTCSSYTALLLLAYT